jgi:hypothetical protein
MLLDFRQSLRIPVNRSVIIDNCLQRSAFAFVLCIAAAFPSVPARAITIHFAGRSWNVKQSSGLVGPGPNRFSNSPNDVWADGAGLHLTIHKSGGVWYSTEVILNASLGYGTYMFQTTTRQDLLNANATFGAFTWDPFGGDTIPDNPNREIDFEDGRWSAPNDPTNSQIVVQPYYKAGNLQRVTLPNLSQDAALTRFFTWSPGKVDFYSLRGRYSPTNFPAEAVIHHYEYLANGTNHLVPTPGRENFRFNLWLFQGTPPVGDQPVEVIVSDFAFLPLKPGDFNSDGQVTVADLKVWMNDFGSGRSSDADADGDTDGADFLTWQRGLSATATAIVAPECPSQIMQVISLTATVFQRNGWRMRRESNDRCR